MRRPLALALAFLVLAVPAQAQSFDPDTVRAGRFDNGKMWTFENPPVDYIQETYGFTPDEAWFERARLASLRLPGCSASFVSPHGLVATNHHCVQSYVAGVSEPGENLLDEGFFAESLEAERAIGERAYLDQLVAITDVTAEVDAALMGVEGPEARAAAREAASEAIQARLQGQAPTDGTYVVQVVSLYNGGQTSAYTFRRFEDVRLVAAPERRLGYFGGDFDNFTFPRYALDFGFLRVYENGEPYTPEHYFPLAEEGVAAGEAVFVIGNPGSTDRQETVAQLEYLRDVRIPSILNLYDGRIAASQAALAEAPDDNARVALFGLLNGQKAYRGRRDGLADPYILARRAAAERDFRARLAQTDGGSEALAVLDQIDALQDEKRAQAEAYRAFLAYGNSRFDSALLRRAELVRQIADARASGVPEDRIAQAEETLRGISDPAPGLERRLLAAQITDYQRYLRTARIPLPEAMAGNSPDAIAERLLATSALATQAGTADYQNVPATDPALQLASVIGPQVDAFRRDAQALSAREADLAARLGRARFEVYGTAVPPDATFSLRFTDGVVRGYDYNGTFAAPFTTLFGLYDHHYSYCVAGGAGEDCDWGLPQRWLAAEGDLDRSTPVNFTSTSDTIGGNSGSPAVNRNLELVGLNFDRTIEGLVRDYIYLPNRGRNVMVDARVILAALDTVYDLDRIAGELRTGTLYPTEAAADAR